MSRSKREDFAPFWDTSFGGGQGLLTMVKRAKRRIVMGHRIGWPREGVKPTEAKDYSDPAIAVDLFGDFQLGPTEPFRKGVGTRGQSYPGHTSTLRQELLEAHCTGVSLRSGRITG